MALVSPLQKILIKARTEMAKVSILLKIQFYFWFLKWLLTLNRREIGLFAISRYSANPDGAVNPFLAPNDLAQHKQRET